MLHVTQSGAYQMQQIIIGSMQAALATEANVKAAAVKWWGSFATCQIAD